MNAAFEASMMPVLTDFQVFLEFLNSRDKTPLTNDKAVLKGKDLFGLNQGLQYKANFVTEKSQQSAFYELDFFFNLVVASKLVCIHRQEKDNYLQVNTLRLREFEALTNAERYFFLLETFWSYINWAKLSETRSWILIEESIIRILYLVASCSPGEVLPVIQHRYLDLGTEKIYFPIVSAAIFTFYFLGFYKLIFDASYENKPDRYIFPITKLIPTLLGVEFTAILLNKRPLARWNFSYRRDRQEGQIPLGIIKEQFYNEDKKNFQDSNQTPFLRIEPFLEPFLSLFSAEEFRNSLYPLSRTFIEGTYHFKVALAKDLYRTIAIGVHHTLHGLHQAIQAAYKFDKDYLYTFLMDNERYTNERYESPLSKGGVFADSVKIGGLDLYVGQQFLYQLDAGGEWLFSITLLTIDTSSEAPKNPKVIDKQGRSPKQYSR